METPSLGELRRFDIVKGLPRKREETRMERGNRGFIKASAMAIGMALTPALASAETVTGELQIRAAITPYTPVTCGEELTPGLHYTGDDVRLIGRCTLERRTPVEPRGVRLRTMDRPGAVRVDVVGMDGGSGLEEVRYQGWLRLSGSQVSLDEGAAFVSFVIQGFSTHLDIEESEWRLASDPSIKVIW